MNSNITFQRNRSNVHGGYDIIVHGDVVGHVAKVPGYQFQGQTMWVAHSLDGKISTSKDFTRMAAAKMLLRNTAPAEPLVDIHTLKHNVRILAAKLSDLMIVEDLTAGEVAKVRQDLEDAAHKLEIALLAQF